MQIVYSEVALKRPLQKDGGAVVSKSKRLAQPSRLECYPLEVALTLCRKGEVLQLDLPNLKAQLKKEYL